METLYTCDEVAERYGVEQQTVHKWVRLGKLKALCIGKSYRFKESALVEFEKMMEK